MNHQGTVRLETGRLILRPFTEEDAPFVFKNWANDSEVTKYLTWQPHADVEASLGFMRFCIERYKDTSAYEWAIVLQEIGEPIGCISVVHTDDAVDAVELGYALGRRYWGQGYMPEAVNRVVAFLFEEVGANRISARHDVNNPNSGKVMRKAGMTYEGTLRQSARNNQGIVDCAVCSILKAEYEERKKQG